MRRYTLIDIRKKLFLKAKKALLAIAILSSFISNSQDLNQIDQSVLKNSYGPILDSESSDSIPTFGVFKFLDNTIYRGENLFSNGMKCGWLATSMKSEIVYYGVFSSDYFVGITYNENTNKASESIVQLNKEKPLPKCDFLNVRDIDLVTLNGVYTIIYKNKDVYVGKIARGNREGYGSYITKEGYVYKGRWADNKRFSPNAMAVFSDGSVYKGEWVDDIIRGTGVLYGGDYVISSNWKQKGRGLLNRYKSKVIDDKNMAERLSDKIDFLVKIDCLIDSNLIEGFKNQKDIYKQDGVSENKVETVEGKVELTEIAFPQGRYVGFVENGRFSGQGIIYYKNGDKFQGVFREGLFKSGTYFFKNQNKLKGEFYKINNDLVFKGVLEYPKSVDYNGQLRLAENVSQARILTPLNMVHINSVHKEINNVKVRIINGELVEKSIVSFDAERKTEEVQPNYDTPKNFIKAKTKESKSNKPLIKILFSILVLVGFYWLFIKRKNSTKGVCHGTPKPITKKTDLPITNYSNLGNSIEVSSLTESEFKKEIEKRFKKVSRESTEIFWVGAEHRTHPWSKQPGGCTVVVLFKDRACRGYDKVKRPHSYIRKVSEKYIGNSKRNNQSSSLESYISEIYLAQQNTIDVEKVWFSNMDKSPWEILEEYQVK